MHKPHPEFPHIDLNPVSSSFVYRSFDAPQANELGLFEPRGKIYETEFDRRLRLLDEGE